MSSNRTARNAAANYMRFFVSMSVTFLLTPYLIHRVGKQDFALWSLTFSVLGFFGLLDMGLGTGVVKYVAECRGAQDTERRNRMVSTLGLVYLLLTLLAVCGLFVLSTLYSRLFSIPPAQVSRALALLWILAARAVLFALPLSLFQGILFGEQKIALMNGIQIVTTLLYGVSAWFGLAHGAGLITLAWINLAAMLAEYGLYLIYAFRVVPSLRLSISLADRSLLKSVASFSLAQFVVSMAALVRLRTDPLIVQWFLPLSQVAVYAVALRIAESALLLLKQGVNVLAPKAAHWHGSGERDKLQAMLLSGSKLIFCAAVVLTTPLCLFSRAIVIAWVGPAFAGAAPVLIVLMLSMCLVTPQLVAATTLAMTGHHRVTARAEVVGMLLNLIVSMALARPLGLTGIALGTLASTLLVDLFYIVLMACRHNGLTYRAFVVKALMPGLLLGGAQASVTLVLKILPLPGGVLMLVLKSLPGVALSLLLLWTLFLSPAERERLIGRRARSAAASTRPLTEGS